MLSWCLCKHSSSDPLSAQMMYQNVKLDRLCLSLIKPMGYMRVLVLRSGAEGKNWWACSQWALWSVRLESNRAWAKFGLGIKSMPMPVGLKWSGRLLALQYPTMTFFLLATTYSLFGCTGGWLCGVSQLALNSILNSNQARLWWLIEHSLGIPALSNNVLAHANICVPPKVEVFQEGLNLLVWCKNCIKLDNRVKQTYVLRYAKLAMKLADCFSHNFSHKRWLSQLFPSCIL